MDSVKEKTPHQAIWERPWPYLAGAALFGLLGAISFCASLNAAWTIGLNHLGVANPFLAAEELAVLAALALALAAAPSARSALGRLGSVLSKDMAPASRPLSDPGKRLDWVDGLRSLAALTVASGHLYFVWFPKLPLGWLYKVLNLHFAVDLFIVISGYCLMLPVVRHGSDLGLATAFFKRRAKRILPAYIAAVLLGTALFASQYGVVPWLDMLKYLSMTAVWTISKMTDIDGVLWTVQVEWWIYFLFPLIVLLWRRIGPRVLYLAAAVSLPFAFLLNGTEHYRCCPQYILLFCMGTAAARFAYQGVRLKRWVPLVAALCFAFGVYLVDSAPTEQDFYNTWPYVDLIVGFAFASLLFISSHLSTPQKLFGAAWLSLLGTFSYSIYVLHNLVFRLLSRTPLVLHSGYGYVACLLILVACAYLFALVFEARYVRKLSLGRKKAAPVGAPARATVDSS